MPKVNKENEELLTQDYIKSILNYNEHTGIFTWIVNKQGIKIGDTAGSFCRNTNYVRIKINGVKYFSHRLAFLYMEGSFPENIVDHINGVRSNNSQRNLRKCTYAENNANRGKTTNNTSGVKGVHWNKHKGMYCARIAFNRKKVELSYFTTLEEAVKAYQEASTRFHGEFANHG